MSKLNVRNTYAPVFTHEGGKAARISDYQMLRRSVLSCLLWEKEFYEDGQTIVKRISELVGKVNPASVANLAEEARTKHNLRHVPLLLASSLAKVAHGKIVEDTVEAVVQRADELAELLAVHAEVNGVSPNNVKKKISAPMKRGLAKAFGKFGEYALAKYNRDGAIKLRDVLFLCHAKPKDKAQADLWKRLIDGELKTPDTWEVQLSAGADKKETFERLIKEGKLGYLALLRNLRNMEQAGCDRNLVNEAIRARKGAEKVLPFRFVAAARNAPSFEAALDDALLENIKELPKLKGRTVVLVDVSGSMDWKLSGKSDLKRIDAAATLASIINADDLRVFSFSYSLSKEIPARRGMAGIEKIIHSQPHGGTNLAHSIYELNSRIDYDRIIVITDEQTHDGIAKPKCLKDKAYLINVASARNGVGYGSNWTHIDGFSESVIRYIYEIERD